MHSSFFVSPSHPTPTFTFVPATTSIAHLRSPRVADHTGACVSLPPFTASNGSVSMVPANPPHPAASGSPQPLASVRVASESCTVFRPSGAFAIAYQPQDTDGHDAIISELTLSDSCDKLSSHSSKSEEHLEEQNAQQRGPVSDFVAFSIAHSDTQKPLLVFRSRAGARLTASALEIRTPLGTFTPDTPLSVYGSAASPPGTPGTRYTYLEIQWMQRGVQIKVKFGMQANETHWHIDEICIYECDKLAERVNMNLFGRLVKTELGRPFVGDIVAGSLYVREVMIWAFEPRLTTCDGTGPAGTVVMELTCERPISGQLAPLDSSGKRNWGAGYAFRVSVLDAVSCKPMAPDFATFRVGLTDPEVALVDTVVFNPPHAKKELYISLSFLVAGKTVLTIEAVNIKSGDVLGSLDVPISVMES